MSAYIRDRWFIHCQCSPSLRNNSKEHTYGGDNAFPASPQSQQGTTFPANASITHIEITGHVNIAGTGPAGGELCVWLPENDDSTTQVAVSLYIATTTDWKRGVNNTMVNPDFTGEDYAATPLELFGRREHYGTSTSSGMTVAFHGKYTGL